MSIIDRPRQITGIVNSTKLLENIHNAMLIHNNLQLYIAILDQKISYILGKKLLYQLFIQRIKHKYKLEFDG